MFNIGRHIHGISLNNLEYLLGDDSKALEFATEQDAWAHLKSLGFGDSDLDNFCIVPVNTSYLTV